MDVKKFGLTIREEARIQESRFTEHNNNRVRSTGLKKERLVSIERC